MLAPSLAGLAARVEQIGAATLYLADCRDLLAALPRSAAIVADPPYGINYQKGAGGGGRHGRRNRQRLAGDGAPFDPAPWLDFSSVVLWGANHYAARLPHGRWMAWDKLAGLAEFDSFSDVEFAWRDGRGKDRIFRYLWKGIVRADGSGTRGHPTQKPVPLMEWCVASLSERLVIDPYCGSGSTGIAALNLGRDFIGIEIDPAFFELACRRIDDALRQGVLFPDGGAYASR